MKLFTRGDIDGFFGLFIDNLLQLMLIHTLCTYVCHFPPELVNERILPGAAISILLGNLFYGWQARQLMRSTGRTDVTALPYGINTPSLVGFIFLVILPVYIETQDPIRAWKVGLFACLMSAVMEIAGAFVGDWLRRHTPRAALLSALAGIAITFISMNFIFQLFASPAIALLPMLIILFVYASRTRLPLGLPAGFVAVVAGAVLAWVMHALKIQPFPQPAMPAQAGFYPPVPAIADAFSLLNDPKAWQFMSVIIPMGLFNVIGSLQNLESAEAAGDRYETRPSLLVNGLGSLSAALLGSPFPTTIYIGHPGWKAMGARAGYSILNGIVITALCLIGGVTLLLRVVPIEAMLGILLWIGIIITAQAFEAVDRKHALAVAIGLVPAFAAWAQMLLEFAMDINGGKTIGDAVEPMQQKQIYVTGMIALQQGFLVTSMLLAAILAHAIDRRFMKAAMWTLAAALLSTIGLIHAYDLSAGRVIGRFIFTLGPDGQRVWLAAPAFTIMYALGAVVLVFLHHFGQHESQA